MQLKLKKIMIGVLGVLILAGYMSVNAAADNKQVLTGTAPNFTLKDSHGNDVHLSQFVGKVVVLEWTNYDCPFVKAHYDNQDPTMTNLAIRYADQGVVWLTINSTHYATPEAVKQWAAKHGIEKQILLIDADGAVGKKYHAKTTPHMFIIDKNGMIVYQGAIDNAPLGRKPEVYINYVDRALTQLLSGQKIDVAATAPYGCSVKYPPENKTDK